MNKAQLIEALEPYNDDEQVYLDIDDGCHSMAHRLSRVWDGTSELGIMLSND